MTTTIDLNPHRKTITEAYGNGYSIREIACVIGVSHMTIHKFIKANNIAKNKRPAFKV